MSKARQNPRSSAEDKAVIASILERSRTERPGSHDQIGAVELDALVSQAQYVELRALMIRLRDMRERMGLSLSDMSQHTGLTCEAISRLETGWNLNPTLETLVRYTRALGVGLKLDVDESTRPTADT
jgi:DNA-binding XRE family transcriptional regulator